MKKAWQMYWPFIIILSIFVALAIFCHNNNIVNYPPNIASAQTAPRAEAAPQPDFQSENLITNEVIYVKGHDIISAIKIIGKSYKIKDITVITTFSTGYSNAPAYILFVEPRKGKSAEIPPPESLEAR